MAAVILAGGRGTRMGTETPKQFLEIAGKPMICHTLKAFEESDADELVLVAPEGGAVAIFAPGTNIPEAGITLLNILIKRAKEEAAAEG